MRPDYHFTGLGGWEATALCYLGDTCQVFYHLQWAGSACSASDPACTVHQILGLTFSGTLLFCHYTTVSLPATCISTLCLLGLPVHQITMGWDDFISG